MANAQGGVPASPIYFSGPTGRPLAGATVTFCTSAGTGFPCSPLASIFTNAGLSIASPNPVTTDGNGNIPTVFAAPGVYILSVTGSGITPTLVTATVAGTGAGNVVIGANTGSISFTGTESDAGGSHSGPETFTSTIAETTGGVFTNTQITNAVSSFVNGVPFPYAGTGFMTAVAGGVTTPSTATAINIDGIYGTAISNCNSVGRTVCNTDGGYFSAQANANGAGVWGINPIALDVAGVANAHITGVETDIGVGGTPAFVRGQTIILTDGGGTVGTMPVNSIGLEILGTHTPTQQWNRGIQIDDGASSLHALQIGAVNNGTSQGGQLIGFARWDSGGVRRTTESININSVGDLLFTQTGGVSTLLHGMGTGNLLTTGSGAGNLLQTKRTAGCTTSGGATPFTGPCTVTVTWPNTFADGNYTVTCTGNGIGAGIPLLQASTTITGASTIVQTQQATGVNASFNNIECIAIHD